MSILSKTLIIIFTMSLLMYIGGYKTVSGDVLDKMSGGTSRTHTNATVPLGYGEDLALEDNIEAGYPEGTTWKLLDSLRLIWSYVLFLINLVTAIPNFLVNVLYLRTVPTIPDWTLPQLIVVLISYPLGFAFIYGIVSMIRGRND